MNIPDGQIERLLTSRDVLLDQIHHARMVRRFWADTDGGPITEERGPWKNSARDELHRRATELAALTGLSLGIAYDDPTRDELDTTTANSIVMDLHGMSVELVELYSVDA